MTEPSREVRIVQFLKICADPTFHYNRPDDVVADNRFDAGQKLAILRQWGKDLLKYGPEPGGAETFVSGTVFGRLARAIETLGGDPGEFLDRRGNGERT